MDGGIKMNKREHLLTCLIEECAEIQKSACKALRFGENDHHPEVETLNIDELAYEIDDSLGVIELLREEGVLPRDTNPERIVNKKLKVLKYMDYAKHVGALK